MMALSVFVLMHVTYQFQNKRSVAGGNPSGWSKYCRYLNLLVISTSLFHCSVSLANGAANYTTHFTLLFSTLVNVNYSLL